MTQQNNEFEKWWNDNPNRKSISNTDKQFARFLWQVAKADSEREIAELKAHINVLREALKGNDFPYSANLDIYNSVRFTDAPYGTMIMESKIVKWLCKNRAKDYFDKMVEGK